MARTMDSTLTISPITAYCHCRCNRTRNRGRRAISNLIMLKQLWSRKATNRGKEARETSNWWDKRMRQHFWIRHRFSKQKKELRPRERRPMKWWRWHRRRECRLYPRIRPAGCSILDWIQSTRTAYGWRTRNSSQKILYEIETLRKAKPSVSIWRKTWSFHSRVWRTFHNSSTNHFYSRAAPFQSPQSTTNSPSTWNKRRPRRRK